MKNTSQWLQTFKKFTPSNNKSAKIFAITGGKGGVGKTTFSLKIAQQLAKCSYKVLLIDCDYNLSNTAIKLGLPPENHLSDLISGAKSFQECLYQNGNFNLFSANNGDLNYFEKSINTEQIILDIIQSHREQYDFIFLDCAAGISFDSLFLSANVDHRIFVVMPDRSSITDSYSLMKILNKKFGIKDNMLVVNQVSRSEQYKKVVATLSATAEQFLGVRTQVIGYLPRLKISPDKFDQEMFVSENSSTSDCIAQIAQNIVDTDDIHRGTIPIGALNVRLAPEQEFTT